MNQIKYTPEHWAKDAIGILTPGQKISAQMVFHAKTRRAAEYSFMKQDGNKLTFSTWGAKRVCLCYPETKYTFGPSGVLQVSKYDPRTDKWTVSYFAY